jgi:hypothetical protein
MLNQPHTATDIAADHARSLRAEAEAYRLARKVSARPARPRRRRDWGRVLRGPVLPARNAGGAAESG